MAHFLNRFLSTRARSLMKEGGNDTLLVPRCTPTHASFVDTHCTYKRSPDSERFKQIKGATNPWIWCLLIKTVFSILAAIPPFFSLNVYWSRQNYAYSLCTVRAYTQSVGLSRSNRCKVVLETASAQKQCVVGKKIPQPRWWRINSYLLNLHMRDVVSLCVS